MMKLKIIFSNKKFAIERTKTKFEGKRNWRDSVDFLRGSMQIKMNKRERKRKRERAQNHWITMRTPPREKEDVKTNKIIRQKHNYNH